MARCRRNVDNFLEACRKIGVEEVSCNNVMFISIKVFVVSSLFNAIICFDLTLILFRYYLHSPRFEYHNNCVNILAYLLLSNELFIVCLLCFILRTNTILVDIIVIV